MLPSIEPSRRSVLQSAQVNPDRSDPKSARASVTHGEISHGLSSYAHRVNARMDRFLDNANPGRYTMAMHNSHDQMHDDEVDKGRFDEIVKQIDVLNGKGEHIVILHAGHPHEDYCLKNRHKIYKIALPTKPVQMNVEVMNLGHKESAGSTAGSITIYGSVDTEHPSGRMHQVSGHESISHAHAYHHPKMDDENCPIDRRKVAPHHKWFFISVEAAWADCRFRVRAAPSSMSIQLTKAELKFLNDQTKVGSALEKRIEAIKNDENEVKDLYDRCRGHRKKKHGDKNIVEANRELAKNADPQSKYIRKLANRIQRCRHEDEVVQREKDNVRDKVERAEEWVHGPEIRAEKRAEEARRMYESEQYRQRIRSWQVFVMLHTSVCLTAQRLEKRKKEIEIFNKESGAASKIQKNYLHKCYAKRRVAAYSNVTRFRMGLTVYIRQMRLQAFLAAGNCLGHMLRNSFIEYSLDVRTAMKKLRWSVLLVQRRWGRLCSIRQARVEVYSSRFRELERNMYDQGAKNEKQKSKEPSLMVPDAVMHHVLYELVQRQQERWIEAVREYHRMLKSGKIDDHAAVAFLTEDGEKAAAMDKPSETSFQLQQGQLEELVVQTQDRWKAGEFTKLLEAPQGQRRKGSKGSAPLAPKSRKDSKKSAEPGGFARSKTEPSRGKRDPQLLE